MARVPRPRTTIRVVGDAGALRSFSSAAAPRLVGRRRQRRRQIDDDHRRLFRVRRCWRGTRHRLRATRPWSRIGYWRSHSVLTTESQTDNCTFRARRLAASARAVRQSAPVSCLPCTIGHFSRGSTVRSLVRSSLLALITSSTLLAQRVDPRAYSELRWRMIGPFRASRTKAAVGIPDQPNVFYIGAVDGGVWKTTDYGRTWNPIFDDQPSGSIGAIAVAPSNPNIIYVGSGEGLQRPDLSTGDGIYKSTDAGKTWTHLGLRDGQQIPQIVVDPRDPNRLFVAVHGPSVRPERRARAVPLDRRRRDVSESLIQGREHRRDRRRARPGRPRHRLLRCSGSRARGRGRTGSSPVRAAVCSSRPTAATRGARSARACRPSSRTAWAASASPSRRAMPSRMFATVDATRDAGLYRSDDAGETLVPRDDRQSRRRRASPISPK